MPNVLDNDNPDLTVERNGIDFDQEILGHFFWGQRVHRRKEIADYVELHADELRSTKPLAFMSREESLEAVARLSVAMLKHAEKALDMTNFEELFYFNRFDQRNI
jgi:hypothetical protein